MYVFAILTVTMKNIESCDSSSAPNRWMRQKQLILSTRSLNYLLSEVWITRLEKKIGIIFDCILIFSVRKSWTSTTETVWLHIAQLFHTVLWLSRLEMNSTMFMLKSLNIVKNTIVTWRALDLIGKFCYIKCRFLISAYSDLKLF